MNFAGIMKNITEAFEITGYSRTAVELQKLSDRQLDDLGISRALLQQGYKAYPWRVEKTDANSILENLTKVDAIEIKNDAPIQPNTPKAA